jgi:DUF1016 N-terminal domain
MSKTKAEKPVHSSTVTKTSTALSGYVDVRSGIVELLNAARQAAARNVNALMTASYWEIGRRIVEAEQKGKRRAGYGEQLIERLSADLGAQFGRGFSARNLEQMRQFYVKWKIPQTASAESSMDQTAIIGKKQKVAPDGVNWPKLADIFPLPWSAYVRLLSVRNDHARQFYEIEALRSGWRLFTGTWQRLHVCRTATKTAH